MSDGDRSDGDDAREADPFDDEPFGEEQFDDEPSGDGASEGADDGLDDPDAHEVDDPFAALGDGIDDGGVGVQFGERIVRRGARFRILGRARLGPYGRARLRVRAGRRLAA
ncbi:hypothetical protein DJ68_16895, partial [Halorubrum sp. C3]